LSETSFPQMPGGDRVLVELLLMARNVL